MDRIDAYLPFGLDAVTLLAWAVGALTFLSVWSLWRELVERDGTSARRRMLERRREELVAAAAPGDRRRGGRGSAGLLAVVSQRLKLAQNAQSEKLRDKLLRAGFRSREAVHTYVAAKVLFPSLFLAAFALAVYGLHFGNLQGHHRPLALVCGVFLGFLAPDIFLANAATKRRQALQKALPDALDLLVICAEAGLSLDSAMHRVASEMGGSSSELADELALTSIELGFLPERRQALLNLVRRTDMPAIRGVVSTLVQTERYGTPLSQALRVLSAEYREQRMLKAEEKAARLPATLTIPMIVFILPTLFVVLMGPAAISLFDNLVKR